MTPMQKLVRLRQIDEAFDKVSSLPHQDVSALRKERDAILASVGNPPAELINSTDGHAWAAAFVETVPGVELEQAFGWFSGALTAGHDVGRQVGQDEAKESAVLASLEAFTVLAQALRQIRRLNLAGSIHSNRLQVGPTAMSLQEFIERALTVAGQPHE